MSNTQQSALDKFIEYVYKLPATQAIELIDLMHDVLSERYNTRIEMENDIVRASDAIREISVNQ